MNKVLRVAFFPDSYTEVNGVAMTSQRLTGFAKKHGYPFLCVHAGDENVKTVDGSVTFLSLRRSPFSFGMDKGLAYDPFFNRHMGTARRALEEFRPDILHLTGLNDVSIIAAYLAYKMQITLVGSWHTNLHEFAARRLNRLFSFLPQSFLNSATSLAEQKILDGAMLYYKMPKIVLAPNQELVDLLRRETGREARLMTRGVDTELYSPAKRTVNDGILRIGTVGRLQAEKNVRMLAQMEHALLKKGRSDFKFLIVGEGYERQWLEQNMKTAEFTGFLQGEQLSAAYANMDIFVFPSETDAFGNVTQEALASGVPALVSDKGGPKFIVREGETGFVCKTQDDYVSRAIEFMEEPEKLARMKKAARDFALTKSWDAVFEALYDAYARAMQIAEERRALVPAK